VRAALRAIGWVVNELIPAQAVRVALNRDYHRVLAERDVWRSRAEVAADALADLEAEQEVHEPSSVVPENPADDCPAPVEFTPLTPGAGHLIFPQK
jgi:hypothetical protein